MKVQLKLLLPTLVVAIAAVTLNFYLNDAVEAASEEREYADLEAETLVSAVLTAKSAWHQAGKMATADKEEGDEQKGMAAADEINRQIRIAQANLGLIETLDESFFAGETLGALLAGLDDWAAAVVAHDDAVDRMNVLAPIERRLADGFGTMALRTAQRAEALRATFEQTFVERVQFAITVLWIIAFAATVFCLYLVRSMISPLVRLANEADRAAREDGIARFKPIDRNDEIGKLSTALSRMVAKLAANTMQISRMALVDMDTGLPNRAKLRARMTQSESDDTLLLVAIEGWERIESIFGSAIAGRTAHGVSSRLESITHGKHVPAVLNHTDRMLARIAPNIFAVYVKARSLQGVEINEIIDALNATFENPFAVGDRNIRLTPHFAASNAALCGGSGDTLIDTAVLALDKANRSRLNAVSIFCIEMRERIIEKRDIEEQLRVALERNEFELFFQPFVTCGSHDVCGAEALLRWRRPSGELVPPGRFIPIAEESGLIPLIDDWVVGEACRIARLWRDDGLALTVSANVSPLRFEQDGFGELVYSSLDSAELPPALLKLEVTETVAMADPVRTVAILEPLRDLGVQLAIDDFGSGYSNLSTLGRLPFDCLKIDRGLLPRDEYDENASQITRAVVELARHLGLKIIAEGIETAWQDAFVCQIGCSIMQGFYFSKPLEEKKFREFVRRFAANEAARHA